MSTPQLSASVPTAPEESVTVENKKPRKKRPLLRYLARRLVTTIGLLWGATVVGFILVQRAGIAAAAIAVTAHGQ